MDSDVNKREELEINFDVNLNLKCVQICNFCVEISLGGTGIGCQPERYDLTQPQTRNSELRARLLRRRTATVASSARPAGPGPPGHSLSLMCGCRSGPPGPRGSTRIQDAQKAPDSVPVGVDSARPGPGLGPCAGADPESE